MSDTRALILHHLLPLVPFNGWTEYSLREAARHARLDPTAIKHAFPRGINDCVEYFFIEADEALAKECPQEILAQKRMPERIESLILARLAHWLPHRETVRRTVTRQSLPWNAISGLKPLYHSIDRMWRLAGDSSTDFSFYTKRITLAGLYTSTLLYWLNDQSSEQMDTHEFLKHRLKNIADFGHWKKKLFNS